MGFDPEGSMNIRSSFTPDQLTSFLNMMLQRARIINLDEVIFLSNSANSYQICELMKWMTKYGTKICKDFRFKLQTWAASSCDIRLVNHPWRMKAW